MKNILLIYPQLPRSFWSFPEIIRLSGKKSMMPPAGLLTLASLMPESWSPRLVDCNVRPIREDDWKWADLVMVSAMLVQREEMLDIVAEAKKRGKTVVVGGPYPTSSPEEAFAAGCDFVVGGEGEYALPLLAKALENGGTGTVICAEAKTDMADVPVPRFDLIDLGDYDAMPVQTSRGCPFACEFCDVINLFGRLPRYKPVERIMEELRAVYEAGHRGTIFFTDDNFIGNPDRAREILLALIPWQKEHGEPFSFYTQASVNLGEKVDLIDLMTEANFSFVFIGIESPETDVLAGADKHQNTRHPLLESISTIHKNGLSVIGSFILGFDNETAGAGKRIEAFIEAANLAPVMINTLQAVPKTRLWDRLKAEGRMLEGTQGDMATGVMNFTPTRPLKEILTEQIEAWENLYEPSRFMARSLRYTLEMRPTRGASNPDNKHKTLVQFSSPTEKGNNLGQFRILFLLIWHYGLKSRHRGQFWRQMVTLCRKNPSRWRRYLSMLAMGYSIGSFIEVIKERAAPALRQSAGPAGHRECPGALKEVNRAS
jgi:radical SAM superfamily enzyme YgiQ (UPF0313 family)